MLYLFVFIFVFFLALPILFATDIDVTSSINEDPCIGLESLIPSIPSCDGWCLPIGTSTAWINVYMDTYRAVSHVNIYINTGSAEQFQFGHSMDNQLMNWITEVMLMIPF